MKTGTDMSAQTAVLVVEAQAIGMIGVIRSLGAAHYLVHAVANNVKAPGLRSRYATHHAVHPAYQSEQFIPWLRDYLRTHQIGCIIPSEGFLIAIRPAFDEFRALIPDAPDADTLYRCFTKSAVEAHCAQNGGQALQQQVPKARVIQRGEPLPSAEQLATFQWPLWLKTDARDADDQKQAGVLKIVDNSTLAQAIPRALQSHQQCLLQEHVPGVKATVNLWRHNGKIRARSMCVAMHENPHRGGLTAYRKFWWHEAMCADAEQRLALLDWQGVAMVEYRWHETSQRFWFLELNARYWNALNMDLLAGKDFPRWQVDAFFGRGVHEDLAPGPLGFAARYTVPADIGYLLSLLRDPEEPWRKKIVAMIEWCLLAMNPRVKSDLWFKGDRALYWRAWWRFFRDLGRAA